jgi:hypothetical protein
MTDTQAAMPEPFAGMLAALDRFDAHLAAFALVAGEEGAR